MKFSSIIAPLALASSVTATAIRNRNWSDWQNCVSQSQAETIVSDYASILSHSGGVAAANATAQALLDVNYVEISDSILSLEGQPLGTATFVGKDTYITGVLYSPAVTGIDTLEVDVANCNKVLWYWKFTGIGSEEYEIKGFNLFTITPAGQINQTNLEFNSIAWALDTGYQVIFPTSTTVT